MLKWPARKINTACMRALSRTHCVCVFSTHCSGDEGYHLNWNAPCPQNEIQTPTILYSIHTKYSAQHNACCSQSMLNMYAVLPIYCPTHVPRLCALPGLTMCCMFPGCVPSQASPCAACSQAVCPPRPHHVLHADGDLIVGAEGAKEAYDVWRVALVQHLQLTHDLVPHGRLDVQHDHLGRREDGGCSLVIQTIPTCEGSMPRQPEGQQGDSQGDSKGSMPQQPEGQPGGWVRRTM